MRRWFEPKHLCQHTEGIKRLSGVGVQLSRSNVQSVEHAHGELVKGDTHMRVCEEACIHEEEVGVVIFSPMTTLSTAEHRSKEIAPFGMSSTKIRYAAT